MPEYREQTTTIDVPSATGVKGFLRTIEEILKLDRVQGITIDSRGRVQYVRYVREDEESLDITPRIAFEKLMPYAVVRNGRVDEVVTHPKLSPAMVIAQMFARVSREKLFPVAFVTGANTTLFEWLRSIGIDIDNREEFYGLPLLRDRLVEDYVLILAAAFGRGAGLQDVQHSFKIVMPQRVTENAFTASQGDHQSRSPISGNAAAVPSVGIPGRGPNGTGSRDS